MSTNAALGASGVSLALGLMNARGLSGLSEEVEKMKASMNATSDAPPVSEAATGAEDIFEIGDDLKVVENETLALDNAVKRIEALEKGSTSLSGVPTKITALEDDMTDLSKALKEFEVELQGTLFDVETIVDLAPDIQDLLTNWNTMSTKAGINNNGMFQAEDTNLSLKYNAGDKSAYRFSGIDSTAWAMYMASNSGKTPKGNAPPKHGKVTSNAIRMSVGGNPSQGFIVENDTNGVFSVNGQGDTLMGKTYCGTLDGETSCVAHANHFSTANCALRQTKEGTTFLNAANERSIGLGNNGVSKVIIEGSPTKTLKIKNNSGTSDTRLNDNGHNFFIADDGKHQVFRFGSSTNSICDIRKDGVRVKGVLYLNGANVKSSLDSLTSKISALTTRVSSLESKQGKYVEFTDTVRLYNHSVKKNLGNDTRGPIFSNSDTRAHYSIVKD